MNALRLLFGTLTILPVRPPVSREGQTAVDPQTAGRAMALSPLAGLLLAVAMVVPLLVLDEYADRPPLLMAVLAIGLLAVLTRAIHLDGLADTADGLGSGRRGEAALDIMRKSDIGPFGVVTLVLVLLLQVTALAECLADGTAPAALFVALVLSRSILVVLCLPAFPAARVDGLGAVVAGSVTKRLAAVGIVLAVVLLIIGLVALSAVGPGGADRLADAGTRFFWIALGGLGGVVGGLGLASWAAKRFGGMTGDVYGAVVETAFTTTLVLAALV